MVYLWSTYGLLMVYLWGISGYFMVYMHLLFHPSVSKSLQLWGSPVPGGNQNCDSSHVVDSDSPIIQSRNAVTSNYTPVK